MNRKFIILISILLVLSAGIVFPQAKPVFSGDPAKFKDELLVYMGSDLSEKNSVVLSSFISKWDSAAFSKENMTRILDLSSQLTGRKMRAVPQFSQFLETLNDFCENKRDDAFLSYWLTGLSEMLFNPRYRNESIVKYVENTSLLIKENLLINTGSVKWKVKNAELKFVHDTVFQIVLKNMTLTCYSQRDSTEIYNASGIFYPDYQQFRGTKGTVTWEKAGYARSDVFAEMSKYTIDITRNTFTCDSALLMHKTYFKKPVYGVLTDQAATISSKEKATYPRFETYTKQFEIKNMYKGVDYEGGLAFEGANVKGKGEKYYPAKIKLFRNDTLFIKIASTDFLFSAIGLNSQETSATLYLGKDSIFHSNLGFSFSAKSRQVNLFRTSNPVSPSPYYNTFHNIDMYFENLTWDMTSSKVIISRAKGAAMGQALFESSSFFNAEDFLKLMSLDDYHPLTRLKKFSEWYYSETFPVSEFAKWLNKPEEIVAGLCIDMANRGFVFYDRTNQEVTIKQKTKDYINSYAGKKDYDVISVYSETKAPVDNAVLDLKNYNLEVNGVKSVFLSDSQRVAIYPYNQRITLEKNRDFKFDGVVEAGLFTFFGHDFQFSYDTFKIRLQKIDSIKVAVETNEKDAYGNAFIRDINSLIQLSRGELYIDDPNNKSGLKSLAQYPIINATAPSYIFYDRIAGLENIYKKENFYFKIDPFTFENIDHYNNMDMNLSGEFFAGNILKPTRQYLTIQENNSLGFQMNIPKEGIDIYEGKGIFYDTISMSNRGLVGRGILKHLTSTTKSEEFRFFPDSMLTMAETFDILNDSTGIYPDLSGQDVRIKWMPVKDEWLAWNSAGKSFKMFANGAVLDGSVSLKPGLLSGTGAINMTDSRITSNLFTFASNAIRADTADYNLKSPSTSGYAFIAENANTDINFESRLTSFHLNTDSSVVKFPEIQYICTMTDFEYDMGSRILSMEHKRKTTTGLISPNKLLLLDFKNLDKPTFFATNSLSDTISFTSLKAKYNVDKEFIEADDISYIHIADALIQPDSGRIIINRRAKIGRLDSAFIAVNKLHLLHSASIEIESAKRYSGSAVYDYLDESNEIRPIIFPEITVDTLTTSARGYIAADQKFMLSPAFSFAGDVNLSARNKSLLFTGSAGILHDCSSIESVSVKFKSTVDPKNVMIKLGDKPRDVNDNIVYSGAYINSDPFQIYPAFLSPLKSWSDAGLLSAGGVLWFNKSKQRYQISSPEKIVDPALNGNMVTLDKKLCMLSGEGKLNFGTNFDLVNLSGAGNITQTADSGKIEIKAIIGLDFYFSPEALKIMSDELRMMPTLKPVSLNSDFNNNGMKDLLGVDAANKLKQETDLFGSSGNTPKEFTYNLMLNDVNLYWNEASSSFRSKGKIGIGFVGSQPINVYVDGYVDIQRRRSGDMIDIYLKADGSTWYYFSYIKGIMMAKSGNNSFNSLLTSIKEKDRKNPKSTLKAQYTYMIAVDDRLTRFLRRMTGEEVEEPGALDGLVR
jgi:hypothetical protein